MADFITDIVGTKGATLPRNFGPMLESAACRDDHEGDGCDGELNGHR
jgi:hypothetical protein